ncbi:unnamed protein product [Adineta steineri]|uniref:Uncharacterized protein n=1 Tax=Adineta steineri TaxID=433720 RepID=A0A815FYI1_9BILA|nr:unnamed protein product [Adineta steineri]CAF1331638.1 unnamed protein product [Adineta steineri]CAF1354588.1 unnamed protein product [Adineta steineri]CAF3484007.1 unnamed protein product [Adineta steineri]CAF3602317.1 unnamed protein product [Adineta steineri]
MPGSSKKISRLEKEAVLRAKTSEYKREQSAYLLTDSYQDEEDFENERHRRYEKIRQAHQIQREIDFQVGMIDKMKERRELETLKKQTASTRSFIATLPPPKPKASSTTDQTNRSGKSTEKKYVYKTRTPAIDTKPN